MKTFIRQKYYRDGASVGNEMMKNRYRNLPEYLKANEAGGGDGMQQNDAEEQERLQKKTGCIP